MPWIIPTVPDIRRARRWRQRPHLTPTPGLDRQPRRLEHPRRRSGDTHCLATREMHAEAPSDANHTAQIHGWCGSRSFSRVASNGRTSTPEGSNPNHHQPSIIRHPDYDDSRIRASVRNSKWVRDSRRRRDDKMASKKRKEARDAAMTHPSDSIWQREPKPTMRGPLHQRALAHKSQNQPRSVAPSSRHGGVLAFLSRRLLAPVSRRFPWDAITSPCLPRLIAPSRSASHTLCHPGMSRDR